MFFLYLTSIYNFKNFNYLKNYDYLRLRKNNSTENTVQDVILLLENSFLVCVLISSDIFAIYLIIIILLKPRDLIIYSNNCCSGSGSYR
ncbi:PLP-dependent transferase [Enterobacteriaceae endosymbiont of Donacia clavipes]|uniref:PLP-dependent transferase n=1 Tax=Enterobacteriaceae endosymbiont of Donacia clavipes TaxID=2675775 RepID=UPI001448CD81|nr:hypothetical protein GJT92_00085 [Enterobacteriaceae endosymbiont of Donacia clavipes]